MRDKKDPHLCGTNIGESVEGMLNVGLDNMKIYILEDESIMTVSLERGL